MYVNVCILCAIHVCAFRFNPSDSTLTHGSTRPQLGHLPEQSDRATGALYVHVCMCVYCVYYVLGLTRCLCISV